MMDLPPLIGDLRILIVGDDTLARAGLVALLTGEPGIVVAGQVSGRINIQPLLETYRPDVILWDLGWNPALALERLPDLRDLRTPVVALTPDADHASSVWATGVRGLLLRDSDAATIVTALKAAYQGLMVTAPALSTAVAPLRDRGAGQPAEDLTLREIEVLRLLAEGLPNKTIARRLGISEHTVKFHVNSIMGKLGVQSRTEAVIVATRLGLVLL